jgi:hypothetical protein
MCHYQTHAYRVDVLNARLIRLAKQIAEFDGSALYFEQVDMRYALTKCPLYMVKRYRRLCNVYARYKQGVSK